MVVPYGAGAHVLDDDASIHQIWRLRANEGAWERQKITLSHHMAARSLQQDVEANGTKPFICLIDYDLKAAKNGVQVIQDLAVGHVS